MKVWAACLGIRAVYGQTILFCHTIYKFIKRYNACGYDAFHFSLLLIFSTNFHSQRLKMLQLSSDERKVMRYFLRYFVRFINKIFNRKNRSCRTHCLLLNFNWMAGHKCRSLYIFVGVALWTVCLWFCCTFTTFIFLVLFRSAKIWRFISTHSQFILFNWLLTFVWMFFFPLLLWRWRRKSIGMEMIKIM